MKEIQSFSLHRFFSTPRGCFCAKALLWFLPSLRTMRWSAPPTSDWANWPSLPSSVRYDLVFFPHSPSPRLLRFWYYKSASAPTRRPPHHARTFFYRPRCLLFLAFPTLSPFSLASRQSPPDFRTKFLRGPWFPISTADVFRWYPPFPILLFASRRRSPQFLISLSPTSSSFPRAPASHLARIFHFSAVIFFSFSCFAFYCPRQRSSHSVFPLFLLDVQERASSVERQGPPSPPLLLLSYSCTSLCSSM